MTAGRFGPLALSLCLPCGGVWFSPEDLQKVIQGGPEVIRRLAERIAPAIHAATTRETSERAPARCPHCAVPLSNAPQAHLPEVRLDHCHFCKGYWIGTDALARIAVLMTPAPTPPPPATPAPAAKPASAPPPPAAPPTAAPPKAFASGPAGVAPSAGQRVAPRAPTASLGVAPPPAPIETGAPPSKLICPGCGESNAPDAAVCWACGKVFGGVIIGRCPRCAGYLHEVESLDVKVGACDGCGGVWAEEGRVGELLRQTAAQREATIQQVERIRTGKIRKLSPGLICEACQLIMPRAPMMVSAEPLDTCPGCGATFLDDGVFAIVLRSGEVW
jgi:Zn-finger nucleic acid-binding protein